MAEGFYKRPLIKFSIELPMYLNAARIQSITDTVWLHGAVNVKFAPKLVEVELRPKPEEAAAVVGALVAAVMVSFEGSPKSVEGGQDG